MFSLSKINASFCFLRQNLSAFVETETYRNRKFDTETEISASESDFRFRLCSTPIQLSLVPPCHGTMVSWPKLVRFLPFSSSLRSTNSSLITTSTHAVTCCYLINHLTQVNDIKHHHVYYSQLDSPILQCQCASTILLSS